VLSVLLLIAAVLLKNLPPFSYPIGSVADRSHPVVVVPPVPPVPPVPRVPPLPRDPAAKGEGKDGKDRDVVISIDRDGVRITPNFRVDRHGIRIGPGAASGGDAAASTPAVRASGAAASAAAASIDDKSGIEIRLPPGADSEQVREAVEEARAAVLEAIRESRENAAEAAQEAAAERQVERAIEKAVESAVGSAVEHEAKRTVKADARAPLRRLPDRPRVADHRRLAILKITYQRTIQAEVKAAVATETADSEQLKRQVVEARMAAMQAQVEPHFLFNTLASIDHLIETDPPRASTMQKNLIALLRASMPSMRDSNPAQHNLGREMAVIRPYLEILKVRMEDRLQASVDVPTACSPPSSRR
jgi:hypothetical protein